MSEPLSDERLAEMRELLDRLPAAPWMASDCENELQVWPESELRRITRNKHGRLIGYSTPYSLNFLLAEWELSNWDPGVDERDDRCRDVADFLAAARNMLPALLNENQQLRQRLDDMNQDAMEEETRG